MTIATLRTGAAAVLLLLGALVGAAHAADQYSFVSQPSWVENDEAPIRSRTPRASDGLRYLLTVDQINLTGSEPVWHRRVSYLVDEARALASAGQFSVGYQPDYQTVQIHTIDVWRDGVRADRRAQSNVEILRRETDLEAGLMDGQHTLNVTIPDLQPGDRVDYSFSVVGFNPVFGKNYYDSYSAAYSDPLGFRRVRVTYPQDMHLQWRVDRPGFEVSRGNVGADRYVDITASDLRKIREEDNAPSTYDAYGRIEISTAGSWNDIASWAAPLYVGRFTDRSVAATLVRKLRLDKNDVAGTLQRAIEYVQGDIRYTGLDMGQNSHAPNAPEVTVARRFGDCKDKSLLLVALLREAGIEAQPVLVNTRLRDATAKRLPGALAFDHVVVRANAGGTAFWIDPTRDREIGDLASRDPLPFRVGLPVAADAQGFVDIPYPIPSRPQVDVGQRVTISEKDDGFRTDFVVVTDYRGLKADAMRIDFQSQGSEEMGKLYLTYMRGFYDGILESLPPSIEDVASGEVARTAERYRLEWKASEGATFGIVLFQLADWIPILKQDARASPLALAGPRFARQSVRTVHPGGWALKAEKEEVRNPYFTFTRSMDVVGESLVITGEWRRLADEAPAKDYPQLKRDLQRTRDLLEFNVDLDVGVSRFFVANFKAWFWPLLAIVMLAASLALCWRFRARNAFAGMVFAPRRTMPTLLDPQRVTNGTVVLAIGMAVVSVAIDRGSEYAQHRDTAHLAALIGGGIGYFLRFFLYAAIVRWSFRLLSKSLPYRDAITATTWGVAPSWIILLSCAMVAVGLDLRVFAEAHTADATQLPGIMISGLLAVTAFVWGLVGAVNAYSAAAATSRRFAVAAIAMSLFIMLLIFGPILLAVHFLK